MRRIYILAGMHRHGLDYLRELQATGNYSDAVFVHVLNERDLQGRQLGLVDEAHVVGGFRAFATNPDRILSVLGFMEVTAGHPLVWRDYDRARLDTPPNLDRTTVEIWLDS